MTKYFLILLFALALNQIKAQSICGGDSLLILDSINFDSLVYQKSDTTIDKIKYTRVTRFNAVSFFSYTVMQKDPLYFKSIKSALYPRN